MNKNLLSLILGTICIGFAPIFVRLCELSPSLIGFYRCFIAAIILIGFQLFLGFEFPKYKSFYYLSFFSGFIFAWDLFFWHQSVHLIGAGMSTILGNTQVFYLLILGLIFYHEKISLKKIFIFMGAFLGVILILQGQKAFYAENDFFYGALYGLLTGLCYALYTTSLKKLSDHKDPPSAIMIVSFASLFTALWLLIFSFFETSNQTSFIQNWKALLGLALVCQIGGWSLISFGLKKVALSISGLIILLQPVMAKVLGVVLFEEPFSTLEIIGVMVLFICIYLGSILRSQK